VTDSIVDMTMTGGKGGEKRHGSTDASSPARQQQPNKPHQLPQGTETKISAGEGEGEALPSFGLGMYTSFINYIRVRAIYFVYKLPTLLVKLKEFLVAMLTLMVVVLVIIVIIVLIRYYHPRLCSVNRSSAFEAYMEGHFRDVENHVFLLRRIVADKRSVDLLFNVGASDMGVITGKDGPCKTVLARADGGSSSSCVIKDKQARLVQLLRQLTASGREQFVEDVTTYYKFYNTIQRLDRFVYSFFARRDILNEHRFVEKNDAGESQETIDEGAVKKYREEFLEPYDELRKMMRELSNEFRSWHGLYHQPWYTNDMFDFLTGVHMLHLMSNEYHDQITFSYDTRKALSMGMQFNIWTLYYVPYAEKTFTVRVPNIWRNFGETFTSNFDLFMTGWDKLRGIFVNLPRRLAGSEMFSNDHPENFDNEEEVVENFGFLKGLISIGEFFGTIIEVALALFKLVSDPINAVFKIIMIVLGTVLGLALLLGHTLLTMVGMHWVLAFVWGWFMAFTISILLTILELLFVVVLTVVFAILWFLDLLTGGLIVKLMRCENLPDEWERRANFAENNKTTRYFGTACCYPCASRFRPSVGGALCERLPAYVPSYCPHQQIITAFRRGSVLGGGLDDPYIFDRYPTTADPSILYKNRPEKEQILLAAFERFREFLGSCFHSFRKYDYINRHVCANLDRLPDSLHSEDVKRKMRSLCSQAYCEYAPRKKSHREYTADMQNESEQSADSARDCLCRKLAPPSEEAAPPPPEPSAVRPATANLFRRTLLMFVTVLLLLVAVYSLSDTASVLFASRAAPPV